MARPGPCKSATDIAPNPPDTCSYSYDANQRLAVVSCYYTIGDEARADWTWTTQGDVSSIDARSCAASEHWTFDAQQVTVTGAQLGGPPHPALYDRATFAFLPLIGDDVVAPIAELGLVSAGSETFTWSMQPGQWVRTSSLGTTATFTFDAAGHLTSAASELATQTFTYDGDQLVHRTWNGVVDDDLRYDAGGNIAEIHHADNTRTVYDYSCW